MRVLDMSWKKIGMTLVMTYGSLACAAWLMGDMDDYLTRCAVGVLILQASVHWPADRNTP